MKLEINGDKFSPVEQENLKLLADWLNKNLDGDLDEINPRDESAIIEFFEGAYYALDAASYFNLTRVQNPDLRGLWK
jgi:hypothetical protein